MPAWCTEHSLEADVQYYVFNELRNARHTFTSNRTSHFLKTKNNRVNYFFEEYSTSPCVDNFKKFQVRRVRARRIKKRGLGKCGWKYQCVFCFREQASHMRASQIHKKDLKHNNLACQFDMKQSPPFLRVNERWIAM